MIFRDSITAPATSRLVPRILMGTLRREGSLLSDSVATAISFGCTAFDTSPSYGTEKALGAAARRAMGSGLITRERLWIQTKIDGWQMEASRGNVRRFVDASMKKLQVEYLDGVLIHWPFRRYLEETWLSLAGLKEKGIVRSIGICNSETHQLFELVNATEVNADIVQLEISPLRPCEEQVRSLTEAGIAVQAYSPLARMKQDLRDNPELKRLAKAYGVSIAQIILSWHMSRGVAPIFTSGNADRIKENLQSSSVDLRHKDITTISNTCTDFKWYVTSYCCPSDYVDYLV